LYAAPAPNIPTNAGTNPGEKTTAAAATLTPYAEVTAAVLPTFLAIDFPVRDTSSLDMSISPISSAILLVDCVILNSLFV